jgi:hypothetical protein
MVRPSLKDDASPEAYAEAMVRCQGYAPSCSNAGECSYDDICFTGIAAGFKRAHKAIDDLIKEETNTATRAWLRLALDALAHNQFITRGAINALKVVAINRAVHEQYGPVTHKK